MHKYVQFTLPRRYWNGSQHISRRRMTGILAMVFEIHLKQAELILDVPPHQNYVEIICTAEQFGQFIIARHAAGCRIEGIKDLTPRLIATRCPVEAVYRRVANKLKISPELVRKVSKKIVEQMCDERGMESMRGIDLTGERHYDGTSNAGNNCSSST